MTSTRCPAPESHRLNAEETYFGDTAPRILTQEQDEAIQTMADHEEAHCEGTH